MTRLRPAALYTGMIVLGACRPSQQSPHEGGGGDRTVRFELAVDDASMQAQRARVTITVPTRITSFEAPEGYAGAPPFLQYLSGLTASSGRRDALPLAVEGNRVTVATSGASGGSYSLSYTYEVPQSVAGQIDLSLPTLDAGHGRFDNNLTFLSPVGAEHEPAELRIVAPPGLAVESSWGSDPVHRVEHVETLVGGMIILGDYRYSTTEVAGHEVVFALRGDYDDALVKEQFTRVLRSQCEIVGSFPVPRLLVVIQHTTEDCCKGTSLTNALLVNIPSGTSFEPFNFPAIGTMSHELFHQWNVRRIVPGDERGAYLFTEGFTNYFAVAALVHAELVPPERFARFLWRYRQLLEGNPKYPGTDHAAINDAFVLGDEHASSLAYQKGPFVAVLLDRALRQDTGGRQSLVTWFRALDRRFGGRERYTLADLRELTIELSGTADGEAARTFDHAFVGGDALDLDELFASLGIRCDAEGECTLDPLPPERSQWRAKVFSARP